MTLFTSVTEKLLTAEKDRAVLAKRAFRGLIISLGLAVFAAVYEAFSHGVWSAAMVFAFLIPLAGVTLLSFLLGRGGSRYMPGDLPVLLWHFGLAVLTVGSVFAGALEIYGTASHLLQVYWWLGGVLAGTGAALGVIGILSVQRQR